MHYLSFAVDLMHGTCVSGRRFGRSIADLSSRPMMYILTLAVFAGGFVIGHVDGSRVTAQLVRDKAHLASKVKALELSEAGALQRLAKAEADLKAKQPPPSSPDVTASDDPSSVPKARATVRKARARPAPISNSFFSSWKF